MVGHSSGFLGVMSCPCYFGEFRNQTHNIQSVLISLLTTMSVSSSSPSLLGEEWRKYRIVVTGGICQMVERQKEERWSMWKTRAVQEKQSTNGHVKFLAQHNSSHFLPHSHLSPSDKQPSRHREAKHKHAPLACCATHFLCCFSSHLHFHLV